MKNFLFWIARAVAVGVSGILTLIFGLIVSAFALVLSPFAFAYELIFNHANNEPNN